MQCKIQVVQWTGSLHSCALLAHLVVPAGAESFHADCPGRREGAEGDHPSAISNVVYISEDVSKGAASCFPVGSVSCVGSH